MKANLAKYLGWASAVLYLAIVGAIQSPGRLSSSLKAWVGSCPQSPNTTVPGKQGGVILPSKTKGS